MGAPWADPLQRCRCWAAGPPTPGQAAPVWGWGSVCRWDSCWGVGALLATGCAGDFPTSGYGPRPGEQTLTHISTAPGGKQATVRLEPGRPAAKLWTQNFQAGKWVPGGERPCRAGDGQQGLPGQSPVFLAVAPPPGGPSPLGLVQELPSGAAHGFENSPSTGALSVEPATLTGQNGLDMTSQAPDMGPLAILGEGWMARGHSLGRALGSLVALPTAQAMCLPLDTLSPAAPCPRMPEEAAVDIPPPAVLRATAREASRGVTALLTSPEAGPG